MAGQGDRARGAAWQLLRAVLEDRQLLAEMEGEFGPLADLTPAERARAARLARMTLRHIDRADAVLKPHLRKAPPPPVRALLRLATVEMLQEAAAAHGAVNAAVALARADRRTGAMAGLVNAVLRKVAETPPAAWDALPPQRLPGWLRGRLDSAWGRAAVTGVEAAHAAGAPLDLTPRDGDADALADMVGGVALPTGSVRLHGAAQVSALPGYAEGAWWVQDAAAALPARLLAAKPGERVADLCAAPGGKTMQLAATGAQVTALDISEQRMARVEENLARTDLSADLVVADALTWSPPQPLDAILLDAPCSATGTIRRHPDLPFAKDGASIKPLFALQAQLLDRALDLLAPGGRLVFCTCSLLPEEGEKQVAATLDRHPGLSVRPADLPGIAPDWRDDLGGLRLRPDFWPDRGGMDGFYMACLVKSG
ncbi:RsmB/NOP family class I SAM-dependent RNA methyltransferase [Rhodovulum adriaticum]|uniref:16S rRNA (Cytosine967-C5)-methyltransferase n=1 Tax=Rhodovulum adriaticum TaxID=35804 RepID=A0A4R2NYH5_RHOAD|nr:transcription antitermination factor NusB [Rhodovulum adriaticum]MBK1634290.1 16S rRNA methyltransferase [Rhodovulum adriaticum]TCP27157.1 16S rRNA (cytosine967-C5)-methyltransferase [Rhodovulum adriaticum]